MFRMILVVTLAAALWPAAPLFADQAGSEKGKQVFAAQKCSLCHAVAGKGNTKGALDDVGSRLTPAEIRQWLVDPEGMTKKSGAQRKPPMKVKPLSAGDLDALVAYLATLKK